jgi:two-component system, LytTR family, sensor kinase
MDRFFKYRLDHIIFWSLTIFFHSYTRFWIVEEAGPGQFLVEIVFRNGLLALVIYLNLLLIIPRFLEKKKYAQGVLFLLVSLSAYVLLKSLHDGYLYGIVHSNPSERFEAYLFYNLSIVLFYFVFATALHLSKQWSVQRDLIRKIELEKLNTELEYLKAQINPHFLFNSINTIYFQIDKQNISARETLSKFSDMLRYQLYECNGHEIPVEKELSYLKNYVELQKLRRDENYGIDFFCAEGLSNFNLPPLLLVPFVENAFKHVSHYIDRKNLVRIDVSKTGNLFRFYVLNTKDNLNRSPGSGGIGLKNVKRRLELLFKDRYLLDIVETNENFEVRLDLKI